ncbi:unnamed protein product, partial [Heterotrigona itama]
VSVETRRREGRDLMTFKTKVTRKREANGSEMQTTEYAHTNLDENSVVHRRRSSTQLQKVRWEINQKEDQE